jgi:hypothetical protein
MGTYYHMDLAYRLGTLVHQGLVNLLNLVWSNQVLALPSLGTLSKNSPWGSCFPKNIFFIFRLPLKNLLLGWVAFKFFSLVESSLIKLFKEPSLKAKPARVLPPNPFKGLPNMSFLQLSKTENL